MTKVFFQICFVQAVDHGMFSFLFSLSLHSSHCKSSRPWQRCFLIPLCAGSRPWNTWVLLHNSRFNFHCYTQREATLPQKLAWKWCCNLLWLLVWKITKGIHLCKLASLNHPTDQTVDCADRILWRFMKCTHTKSFHRNLYLNQQCLNPKSVALTTKPPSRIN